MAIEYIIDNYIILPFPENLATCSFPSALSCTVVPESPLSCVLLLTASLHKSQKTTALNTHLRCVPSTGPTTVIISLLAQILTVVCMSVSRSDDACDDPSLHVQSGGGRQDHCSPLQRCHCPGLFQRRVHPAVRSRAHQDCLPTPTRVSHNNYIYTRRRMHSIIGERERANWGRVSTLTCAASLVSAASQSHEAPLPSGFSAI